MSFVKSSSGNGKPVSIVTLYEIRSPCHDTADMQGASLLFSLQEMGSNTSPLELCLGQRDNKR